MKYIPLLLCLAAPVAQAHEVTQARVDSLAHAVIIIHDQIYSSIEAWSYRLASLSNMDSKYAPVFIKPIQISIGEFGNADPSYVMNLVSEINPNISEVQFKKARNAVLKMTNLYEEQHSRLSANCHIYMDAIHTTRSASFINRQVVANGEASNICLIEMGEDYL